MGSLSRLIRSLMMGAALCCLHGIPVIARPWAEIVASGQVRVAVKDNLRPLGFRDLEGELQGFEIELAQEIGSRLLGSEQVVELIPVSNLERLEVLIENRVDLAIAQIGITPDRARQVDFTSAYYQDGPSLVVARSSGWERWSDLRGGRVAVLQGSSAIPYLNRYLPGVELVAVDSYVMGAELLLAGEVQAWAADRSILAGWLAEHPDYQFLGSPLATVGLGIAMSKGLDQAELRLRVRRELEELRASGWLAERAQAWGLP
ncbi:transporter substrate-binding domain-containing protein [Thermostichus vulcanus]|uniref:Transporter substrate-binding domain-containing protein n=1 Tax=Thermostichus vulcanus str. 'Rupite' TaxID=2813851 RepID=A0ABT0CBT4_THEVL|nr:transporter substrate-binding domain-containing protein [Thermostichus vulcanus]MCJ2543247.1 transporter substrate-binding domain-containing protein [Thermostichus vulcanus str. 'Rupite']